MSDIPTVSAALQARDGILWVESLYVSKPRARNSFGKVT